MTGIKLNITPFAGDVVDDESLTYAARSAPLHHLFVDVINKLQQHEYIKSLPFEAFKRYSDEIEPTAAPTSDIELDIVLIDTREVFEYWDEKTSSSTLGFYARNSGAFESQDDDVLAKKHRAIILVSNDELLDHVEAGRRSSINPNSTGNDVELVYDYLATITYDVICAREFILANNGLTSSQVGNIEEELSIEDKERAFTPECNSEIEDKAIDLVHELSLDQIALNNLLSQIAECMDLRLPGSKFSLDS